MIAVVPNLLVAGALLAAIEIGWVLVRARHLFLSDEFRRAEGDRAPAAVRDGVLGA